jgi:hypothetical protein
MEMLMADRKSLELAKLIAELLPVAVAAYREIAANHREAGLKPVEEIVGESNAIFERVKSKAQDFGRR